MPSKHRNEAQLQTMVSIYLCFSSPFVRNCQRKNIRPDYRPAFHVPAYSGSVLSVLLCNVRSVFSFAVGWSNKNIGLNFSGIRRSCRFCDGCWCANTGMCGISKLEAIDLLVKVKVVLSFYSSKGGMCSSFVYILLKSDIFSDLHSQAA